MSENTNIVSGEYFHIEKIDLDEDEVMYMYHSWNIHFLIDHGDMVDYLRSMTDPESQKRMKKELQELETDICERLHQKVTEDVTDGLMKHVGKVNEKEDQIGTN